MDESTTRLILFGIVVISLGAAVWFAFKIYQGELILGLIISFFLYVMSGMILIYWKPKRKNVNKKQNAR